MSQGEALLLTIAVEVVVAMTWFAVARWLPRCAWWRAGIAVAGASLVTHPFAWQANVEWLRALPFVARAAFIEIAVAAVEGALLVVALRLSVWRAAAIAAIMNAASFTVGLAVMRLLGP